MTDTVLASLVVGEGQFTYTFATGPIYEPGLIEVLGPSSGQAISGRLDYKATPEQCAAALANVCARAGICAAATGRTVEVHSAASRNAIKVQGPIITISRSDISFDI